MTIIAALVLLREFRVCLARLVMVEPDRLDQVPHLRWHCGRTNPMTEKKNK